MTITKQRSHSVSVHSSPDGSSDGGVQPDNKKLSYKVKVEEVSEGYDSDMDLEKQLIISAGGRKDMIWCFILKLVILCLSILGCSILIFYALGYQ